MVTCRRRAWRTGVVTCSLVALTYIMLYRLQPVLRSSSDYRIVNRQSSIQNISSQHRVNEKEASKPTTEFVTTPARLRKKFDILINSYMRSGSSFTGQLLAFRPDTFYWYEPLWNINSGVYYWGPDKVCFGKTVCAPSTMKKYRADGMHETLVEMYGCNFTHLTHLVAEEMTPNYSGDIWEPYKTCRGNHSTVSYCLQLMATICRQSTHRATKVIRLTVDNLEPLLAQMPNLKVIHLLRDPRAILNSRITTTWYRMNAPELGGGAAETFRRDAEDVCKRIEYDLKASEVLKKKYPDRFAVIVYEDMQDNLDSKARILYDYFGIDAGDLNSKLANMSAILKEDHTVSSTNDDFANWWREHLSFTGIETVQTACGDLLTRLGYTVFKNSEEVYYWNRRIVTTCIVIAFFGMFMLLCRG